MASGNLPVDYNKMLCLSEVQGYSLVVQSQCFTQTHLRGKCLQHIHHSALAHEGRTCQHPDITTQEIYRIQIQHGALWAAAETSMGDGCWCNTVCVGGVFETYTQRSFTATLLSLYCLTEARGPHLQGELLIQRKVFPNVSSIFQYWHTAAASYMNKVYLETLLELNSKQIWMFYLWS